MTTPPEESLRAPGPGCPRVLIVLLSAGWTGIARLPRVLVEAGFAVASLCPPHSFLALTRFVHHRFPLPGQGNPLHALDAAVRHFEPDLLIPGCDAATAWLQNVVRAEAAGRWPAAAGQLLGVVKRSLGEFEPSADRLSKHHNLALAASLGLPTPEQHSAADPAQACDIAAQLGWPVVLKSDTGAAGTTVRICADAPSVRQAFDALRRQMNGQAPAVQRFVSGDVAMCAGVAFDGRLLDAVSAIKLHTFPGPTSPCSVHRFIHRPDMEDGLHQMVRAHRFTGFCAADFVLEQGTGRAWFLELNPRPTPLTTHAALYGHDLAQALHAQLLGRVAMRNDAPMTHDTVALFPAEWARDPHSRYLREAYHDVPRDDPALLQALLRSASAADVPPALG